MALVDEVLRRNRGITLENFLSYRRAKNAALTAAAGGLFLFGDEIRFDLLDAGVGDFCHLCHIPHR